MAFAQSADGTSIYFEVEGSGPPVLLHHGFMSSIQNWRDNGYVEHLADTYRVIAMDGRGHGHSGKPHDATDYLIRRRVDDVCAVLDLLDLERVHFVGYSMGGRIGFAMAKHEPDRLSSLVIGGMHPYRGDAELLTARAEVLADGMEALLSVMELYGGAVLEPYRSMVLAGDSAALLASTLATRDDSDLGLALAEVTLPTLLWCGTDDPGHDGVSRCAAEIPNAEFVALDGLDHIQGFSVASAVLPHITTFLDRLV